ncbi:hypothetical protein B0J13DRAFT_556977 [Dactylonectria estremocensis]|uniref:PNPLA domain-containing protein n=1 Tax=Dactylonectria estremocensis TaxID=1079267 RepID=A0A9P9EPF1_9HYPO|nr:hypothetical protein B0J13DRAFT_556977 [Dactylonectria estremocensis]
MAHRRANVVDLDAESDDDVLGSLAIEHGVQLQPSLDFASQENLRQTPVSWPPPPTRFIGEKAAKLAIPTRCYLCPKKVYLRDLVMCSNCGPAHKPAHSSCLARFCGHQTNIGLGRGNITDDMCEEIKYVDYVFTRYLLDTTALRHNKKALHAEDALCTWIGVPYYQYGKKPQIYVWPRLQCILDQGPVTAVKRHPSLVSFIGDTGSGKSTLIRAMIQMIRPGETHHAPVPGSPDDDFRSTSSDIHVYGDPNTRQTSYPIFYVDCEGFVGGANPIAREQIASLNQRRTARDHRMNHTELREQELFKNVEHYNQTARKPLINLQWGKLVPLPRATHPDEPRTRRRRAHVDDETQEKIVKRVYPKILYAFSDVICFVTANSRSSQHFLKRLIEWAKEAYDRILNQRVKPAVIIIINKYNDDATDTQRDLTQEMLQTFEQTQTYSELVDFWTQRQRRIQSARDVLDCYYRSIKVISVPVYGRRSLPSTATSISTAIQRLYSEIQASTKEIRDQRETSNTSFDVARLDKFLNDSLRALAKDYRSSLDFHRLAAGISLRPKLFSEHLAGTMANLAQTRGLDETDDVGGEQDVADDLARFAAASIAVQLPWDQDEGEIQNQRESLVQQARDGFELYRWRDWRCEAIERRGTRRCRNYPKLHRKGHQFERSKDKQAAVVSVDDVEEDSHMCTWDPERFHNIVWRELRRLTTKTAARRRLTVLGAETEISDVKSQRTCLMCLSHCPSNMLPCRGGGHGICEDCVRRFADQFDFSPVLELEECPLGCSFTTGSWSVRVKPKTAGPRVLALDGGGGVRAIVQLAILNQIEREAGIRIDELFDLVVGTGTGGIVALGFFHQGWIPENSISTFQKLAKHAFSLRMRLGAPVIKSLVQPFCSFRYTSGSVERAMQEHFGTTANMFESSIGDKKKADWVKVGVMTCLQSQNQSGLVANYSRDLNGSSENDPLIRAEQKSKDFKIWEAARATTAAPFYFQPFTHHSGTYEDGAMADEHPMHLAFSECSKIWPGSSRPDILVSIGTGLVVDEAGQRKTQNDPKTEQLISILPAVIRKQVETSYNTIKSTNACENAWKEFVQDHPADRRDCHRLNIALDKDVKLDDVKEMGALNKAFKKYLDHKPYFYEPFSSLDDHVCAVSRRLIASLFCFSHKLNERMRGGHARGWIFCRIEPGSSAAKWLSELDLQFRVLHEPTSPEENGPLPRHNGSRITRFTRIRFASESRRFDPQDMVALVTIRLIEGSFRRAIQLHSPAWRGPHDQWEAISGFQSL